MKARFLLLMVTLASVFQVVAAGNQSTYKTQVNVDGVNSEWKSPLPRFNQSTGLSYDIANDERNIYMIIRVADTTSQRQILQNGLEVWINQDGKKKNTTGITYPMAADKAKTGSKVNLQPGYRPDGFPKNINELTLTGFLLENGRQPVKGCPVKVAIRKDSSDCIVYELAIPFNTFYKEQLEKEDLKNKFYIGFVVKGVPVTNEDDMRRMVMSRVAMGGGFPGGGPDGPRGMDRMMSAMSDLVDKICWQKIMFTLK